MAPTALLLPARKLRMLAVSTVFASLAAPALAQTAPSASDLEARLAALQAQLSQLQAEIATLKQERAATDDKLVLLEKTGADTAAKVDAAAKTDGFKVGNTTIKFNGFVKVDGLISSTSDGDIPGTSVARNFYVPNAIPVAADGADDLAQEDVDFDTSAQQTRLIISTSTPIGKNALKTLIEGDFQSAPGDGSELFTNAFDFAIRRAFIQYGGWTIGQDWTTFLNPALNFGVETADFIGPTEGVAFVRQPLVRYSFKNGLSLALENPETTVSVFGGAAGVSQDDEFIPDLIARYDGKAGPLTYAVSSVFSVLSSDAGAEISKAGIGWGFNAQGKWAIGKDQINFGAIGGRGIGRYVGLGVAPDAVVTLPGAIAPGSGLPEASDLDPIALVGGFIAYRHVWAPKWRSTLSFSAQNVFNNPAQGALSNDLVYSVFGNLFWSPFTNFNIGVEGRFAERQLVGGLEGNLIRGQFTAKYTY